ncbi:MAG: DNA topoisomerase III, partial [Clostridia bacterium]|nr:DNA topoisomerase III [Clostridia bacterium]
MKLIIAEKPSLARNIADAIGKSSRRDGYLEVGDYLVTWAFGHLFSLADVEDYPEYAPQVPLDGGKKKGVKWTLEKLPCFPVQFKYVLREDASGGVSKQFSIIRTLCRREDVDTVINAGDADREGEIIVRLCMIKAGCPGKALKRLWLPDQTAETVNAALNDLKDEVEYDNLANEGFARTYIDWLYGINLTRYATIKSGKLLRVGRVVVPIVKAIYERDLEIENFVPKEYYALVSNEKTNGEEVELVSKKQFDYDRLCDAEALCEKYNAVDAVVTDVKKKKDKLSAGKLYSLSKLQSFLGKKYKMSMSESLEIVQKLYEQGYLTYPRTNSEYLATAEKDKIAKIISNCKNLGYPVVLKTGKNIFDDEKIESHSAITPTYKIPEKGKLSEKEYQV